MAISRVTAAVPSQTRGFARFLRTFPFQTSILGFATRVNFVVSGHAAKFAAVLISGVFLAAFVSTANPLALKYLFDEGIIRKNFSAFLVIAAALLAIFSVWRGLDYLHDLYTQRLKNDLIASLTRQMLNRFYAVPYDRILEQSPGYYVARIYDDVASVSTPLVDTVLKMAVSGASAIASDRTEFLYHGE